MSNTSLRSRGFDPEQKEVWKEKTYRKLLLLMGVRRSGIIYLVKSYKKFCKSYRSNKEHKLLRMNIAVIDCKGKGYLQHPAISLLES